MTFVRKLGKSKKRKHDGKETLVPLKKQRKEIGSVNDLPWKIISRPNATGFEGDDGILELEEVDNVEVLYEETENGRVAKFKVIDSEAPAVSDVDENEEISTVSNLLDDQKSMEPVIAITDNEAAPERIASFDAEKLLPNWCRYMLHPSLLNSLYMRNFIEPTPIQRRTLPSALKGKDVVGVAETGSGKTLAYGLPILHYLLASTEVPHKRKRTLKALIVTPTRELALQVAAHLKDALSIGSNKPKAPSANTQDKGNSKVLAGDVPPVSIVAVVGGMATQKQKRLLERGADIIVATPGRLWDLIEEDDHLTEQIKQIKFLVLDEADRMIETGHFAELDNIVRLTTRAFQTDDTDENFRNFPTGNKKHTDEDHRNPAESSDSVEDVQRIPASDLAEQPMQTFVFSATLSRELQHNFKKRKNSTTKTKRGRTEKPASTLDDLLMKLDFRDPDPEVIDLSPKGGVVSTLQESQIECLSADKDVYLYYFLLRYPGRSLVFLSSIDGVRRLLPMLELLQLKAFPLHSQLQQRQRLKNLDRFKEIPNSILLATDVAARGLDIPSVDHVIHYQIPRSADVYIHRNGRTARASRDGFSLLMCAPDERRMTYALLAALDRAKEKDIPNMPIELDLLDRLKTRVQLAKKIDTSQHRLKKQKHEKNWLREAAEAMEIEIDSDFSDAGSDDGILSKTRGKESQQTHALKAELQKLLSQPLVSRGVMKKYITSGTQDVVSDLLADEDGRAGLLGFKRGDAKTDVAKGKAMRKQAAKTRAKQKG